MRAHPHHPPHDHVVLHVRDVLAADGRVGELGLDPVIEGDVVVVRGAVSTDGRKAAVVTVVREVLDGHGCDFAVRDETTVACPQVPDREPEQL